MLDQDNCLETSEVFLSSSRNTTRWELISCWTVFWTRFMLYSGTSLHSVQQKDEESELFWGKK